MTRYEQDFYGWTQEQAALLKEGRLTELDVLNLIEELESMGGRDRRELRNRLIVLVSHLLKWRYQLRPEAKSWRFTIREQRRRIQWLLEESPSLWPLIPSLLAQAYPAAREHAAQETDLPLDTFPEACPWSVDEVLQGTTEEDSL
jgi:hypothetical protein